MLRIEAEQDAQGFSGIIYLDIAVIWKSDVVHASKDDALKEAENKLVGTLKELFK